MQNGDQNAFEQMIKIHHGMIKNSCKRYWLPGADYDDIYQEALIAFYLAVLSYSPEHNVDFPIYARIVISRKLKSMIRMGRTLKHEFLNRSISMDMPIYEAATYHDILPDQNIINQIETIENPMSFDKLIKSISLSPLEVIVLKMYLQNKTYVEMSLILQCNTKSIDNTMQRVRKKIKKHYAKQRIS
ncbi:sigma-70 family RNA polymerase sigma factor [Syntrophomonas palmitatica]|uniref:sigma-70 family RNA polymerase sigma factor n=1 Tax=Syntrophomonas palmitatica TaxID=402877 RepID=UPI0006CFB655|nr:sigma-70 family RNA polymerase sigma factor [Syntrophomonas palmitatica]